MEENGMRARNFRREEHNNRRVFLRSYPLQWEEEEEEEEEEAKKSGEEISRVVMKNSEKKPMKKVILSIIHWSEGKVVIFRRFKDKLTVHTIACIPKGFKPHKNLILA